MGKSAIDNKMANSTSEHVVAAGTDSNTKFKWSDDFVVDLLKALITLRQWWSSKVGKLDGVKKFNKLVPWNPKILLP